MAHLAFVGGPGGPLEKKKKNGVSYFFPLNVYVKLVVFRKKKETENVVF